MIRSVEKYHRKIAFQETDYTDSQAGKNRKCRKMQISTDASAYLQITAMPMISSAASRGDATM
jgi:hypothetical protein